MEKVDPNLPVAATLFDEEPPPEAPAAEAAEATVKLAVLPPNTSLFDEIEIKSGDSDIDLLNNS